MPSPAIRTRGFFILVLIVGAIGGALALFAWRAPSLEGGAAFEPVSRETALLLNNVFLAAAAATVFVGTLYPLALDALTGTKISVGPPYFAITFAPIFIALLLLVPFGPRLGWRKGDLTAALRTLAPALGIAAVAALAILAFTAPRTLAGAGAFARGGLADRRQHHRSAQARARTLQAGAFAAALAHAGLGVTLIGVAGTTLWRSEALEVLAPGETMKVGRLHACASTASTRVAGSELSTPRAPASRCWSGGAVDRRHASGEARLSRRRAGRRSRPRSAPPIVSDLYLALGDRARAMAAGSLRAYVNPLAPLIWLGALVMALGGLRVLWGRLRAARRPRPSPSTAPAE